MPPSLLHLMVLAQLAGVKLKDPDLARLAGETARMSIPMGIRHLTRSHQ